MIALSGKLAALCAIIFLVGLAPQDASSAEESLADDLYVKALKAYVEKDCPGAIKLFRETLAVDPKYVNAHRGLGKCYYTLGKTNMALDSFRTAYKMEKSTTILEVIRRIEKELNSENPTRSLKIRETRGSEGLYISLFMSYNSIWGDFGGEKIYEDDEEFILIPSIEDNYGLGIIAGLRGVGLLKKIGPGMAIELEFLRTIHDVSWAELTGEAQYTHGAMNALYFLRPEDPLQFHGILGFHMSNLIIKGAASDGSSVADVVMSGIGGKVGAGISYSPAPKFSLTLTALYRFTRYGSVKGIGQAKNIVGSLLGGGPGFRVSITHGL